MVDIIDQERRRKHSNRIKTFWGTWLWYLCNLWLASRVEARSDFKKIASNLTQQFFYSLI